MVYVTELAELAAIWLATYTLVFGSYLAFGAAFTWWGARHPERKIQPRRDGQRRRGREIRASARSLVVTCGCFAGGLWCQLNGYTLFDPWALTWWSAPLMFAASVVLFDTWFYWAHRLNHWGPFKTWHVLHHQAVAPTVWSNYADTVFDAFSQQSFFLVMPILVPFPPAIFVTHRAFDHFNGMIGHSGYEVAADRSSRYPSPVVCVTFHDLHHATYNYNYANHFSFWDRLMGTIHPDYDRRVEAFEQALASRSSSGQSGEERPAA